jgi:4-amino-4-deoxy-L-arabinose transferase-like glycosyltransferase
MIQDRDREHDSLSFIVVFILLFSLFSLFFNLGGRSLENQDSIRYAEIAREILETGDWVMMRFGGEIYIDKPPLHVWNIALSYRLFGINPLAARFPSAFLGLIGVCAVLFFGMGIDKGNRKTGIYAALFLLASYGYAYYSRTTRNDIEYAVFFSLCLISFCKGYEIERGPYKILSYIFFWLFMGFALLVKGPVALIPLVIISVYLFIRRDRVRVGVKILIATSPVLLIPTLPWIIALLLHPDFHRYMDILQESTIMTRKASFFYYLPEFFKKFFPGSVFFIVSLPVLWRSRKIFRENPRIAFFLTWAVVYFLIIHVTTAKNHRYLLPVFPAFAILAGWGFSQFTARHKLFKHWNAVVTIMAGIICLGVPISIWIYRGWSWKPLFFALMALGAFLFVMKMVEDSVVLFCIFCALSLLSLDLARTAVNPEVSDIHRLYSVLQEENIHAEDILLYRTARPLRNALSFYYNRLVRQQDKQLKIGKKVKAIITYPSGLDDVARVYGKPTKTGVIRDHHGKRAMDFNIIYISQ